MARQAEHTRSTGSSHNLQLFSERSDQALVKEYRRGSQSALDALMLRYHQFVRLKASSYFLAGGDSEDLIQETMIQLMQTKDLVLRPGGFVLRVFHSLLRSPAAAEAPRQDRFRAGQHVRGPAVRGS